MHATFQIRTEIGPRQTYPSRVSRFGYAVQDKKRGNLSTSASLREGAKPFFFLFNSQI